MGQSIQEWTKENLWKTAFKKLERVWSALARPYRFEFFKGFDPQVLIGPFLNTLSHLLNLLACEVKTRCTNDLYENLFPIHQLNFLKFYKDFTTCS